MKKYFTFYFLEIIKLLVVLLVLLSLAGYFGTVYWMFELTAHFKLQYLLLLLGCVVILLWKRWWGWAIFAFWGVVLNGLVVLPWYFPNSSVIPHTDTFKLLLANVNIKNKNYSPLFELIVAEKPTMFILQEGNRRWVNHLQDLFAYQFVPFKSRFFGTSIFSQLPFEQIQALPLGSQRESLHIKIKINEKIISLVATHPFQPTRQYLFDLRNNQLVAVQSYLDSLSGSKILIGDLNISMWSPFYLKIFANSKLINVRQGFGVLPSWPTFLPIFMIPIDHCLVSPDLKVVNVKTGPSIGSDHLPLIVELRSVSTTN